MKKIMLLAVIAICGLVSFGQKAPKFVYCEIVGTSNFAQTKVTIAIDYGDPKKFGEDTRVRNEEGKVQKFNSMIDALNYMGKQGWEFEQAYVVSVGNQNVYRYLMKKPFAELEQNIQKILMEE